MSYGSGPQIHQRWEFTSAAEYLTYCANYIREFQAFAKQYGAWATTFPQQYEMARLMAKIDVAQVTVSNANKDRSKRYLHRDNEKNRAMFIALYYWKMFADVVHPAEASGRFNAYVEALPPRGRRDLERQLKQERRQT